MDSATWCWTPAAASAARRLRPEVSKNSSTALSSNEGELARSITTCVPTMASLRPSPVIVLTPVLGEAATTSWPAWCRMATVFEPIRPVPPMTTIFMPIPPAPANLGDSRPVFLSCPHGDSPPRPSLYSGTNTGAPLSLMRTTVNFAGFVLLAFLHGQYHDFLAGSVHQILRHARR